MDKCQEMMYWRPIESAPKDGTMILLAEPNPGGTEIPWFVCEGRWIENLPHSNSTNPNVGRYTGWVAAYPAVYSDGKYSSWHCKPIVGMNPTYWMPKPTPPNQKGNNAENC